MKEIVRLGVILLIITAVAAASLGFTYEVTLEKITEARNAADVLARQEVFSEAEEFTAVSDDILAAAKEKNTIVDSVFEAKKGSETIGYVVKVKPVGFGGAIDVTVGIMNDGTITGVRMGNHQETPGLGDNAKKPDFYEQYNGLTVAEEVVVTKSSPNANEIQAMSGATITSSGMTDGVNAVGDILDLLSE